MRLSRPERLVYSAHDYGPEESGQSWLRAVDFPNNLPGVWVNRWAYLQQQGIAPVLVGEFGGRSIGSDPEGAWQRTLISFLEQGDFSYTYWVWNPDAGCISHWPTTVKVADMPCCSCPGSGQTSW